ncbi:dihydrofolate reductase family protein [Sandaracinus amylolyticus]|nr:dihydrofolate reductase family protein [Sandaracinus amylolyticus]
MRRIVMFERVSSDGFFARPDGSLDWAVPDPELDRDAASTIPRFDTILLGRRTFEMFEVAWRPAEGAAPTDEDPHAPGRRSDEMRAMGRMIDEATKWVFSRTLATPTWRNSKLVRAFEPREIEALKRSPGKDVIVFGSGSIVSALTAHGLIDEYQLVVCPLLLGRGRPWLDGGSLSSELALQEAKAYRSGNVMLRYTRRGDPR